MMKENFINKEFIDDTIFLEYIKDEIKKRGLESHIKKVNFDGNGVNEYNAQEKCITINLNDILFKSSNIIENMITKREQKAGIIKDMNNVNIYNLYVINHELEHVNQTKFLLDSKLNSKYLNFKYSLLVKDLLLVDNIFTFLNKNTYYKYHDIFFSEYDADINSFINTLNFINSLDIDIIEKNIQKFNILIAKTLLKRYKNIKSNTPYENFMNLYHSIFEYLKIESKYHIKNEDYDFPSSQIERLKLGVDISKNTYKYLTLVSKEKHKTLNLFNDIMNI